MTLTETLDALRIVEQQVTVVLTAATPEQLTHGDADSWSAADYLKHLLISIKPVAKLLGFRPEDVIRRFGTADHPSRTYAEIERLYRARLTEGVRAEDYQNILPTAYRFPEGVQDELAHLKAAWAESNQRLIDGAAAWSEEGLDRAQVMHPALGMITMREMIDFTLVHNRIHAADIENAVRK